MPRRESTETTQHGRFGRHGLHETAEASPFFSSAKHRQEPPHRQVQFYITYAPNVADAAKEVQASGRTDRVAG